MADSEQLRILKEEGVQAWNEWREQRPEALLSEPYLGQPRFSEANLRGADFRGVNLKGANLTEAHLRWAYLRDADLSGAYLREADLSAADLRHADLSGANLWNANLSGADLREADLRKAHLSVANLIGTNLWNANLSGADLGEADLRRANLSGANLSRANLRWAYLREADLSAAYLSEADLSEANLIGANLNDADLTGCHIFGVSAWQLKLSEGTKQQNLVITRPGETQITVDEIEVAQFLYLLLHNECGVDECRSDVDCASTGHCDRAVVDERSGAGNPSPGEAERAAIRERRARSQSVGSTQAPVCALIHCDAGKIGEVCAQAGQRACGCSGQLEHVGDCGIGDDLAVKDGAWVNDQRCCCGAKLNGRSGAAAGAPSDGSGIC
jgi:uncharacterized protein YjbI with pentapeptide repeats